MSDPAYLSLLNSQKGEEFFNTLCYGFSEPVLEACILQKELLLRVSQVSAFD